MDPRHFGCPQCSKSGSFVSASVFESANCSLASFCLETAKTGAGRGLQVGGHRQVWRVALANCLKNRVKTDETDAWKGTSALN
jgi:hypothetical protein